MLLRQGANVNVSNGCGYTPLHWAASRGGPDSIRALREKGANLEARSGGDETPFVRAEHKVLLDGIKAKIEEDNDDPGLTAVLLTALDGMERWVGLSKAANATDNETPLHKAARENNVEGMVELLIQGADENARNHAGKTPLDLFQGNIFARHRIRRAILKRSSDRTKSENETPKRWYQFWGN
jgi:ankyrin repeat protein